MALETNQYDIIYGKLLGLGFAVEKARTLAKNLYDVSGQLDITVNELLRYVTADGIRFDNAIYTELNRARTNSSQIGYIDETNIPSAIRQQAV